MAESTLALTLPDIEGEVGAFLGYGSGSNSGDTAWNAHQQRAITRCVKAGLRQFYFPPPLPGSMSSYDWSFMRPVGSVGLEADSQSVNLPDDFGGIEGLITLTASGSRVFFPVKVVGEGLVRQRYADLPDQTGRPEIAAVNPLKGTTTLAGQRFGLTYWPKPDQAYTASFAYYLLPDALTDILPFTHGGMLHCETIRESCLAVAEETMDDTNGVHKQKFAERLAASISADRKFKDQTIGYNADRSDDRHGRTWRDDRFGNRATYNGVYYGG